MKKLALYFILIVLLTNISYAQSASDYSIRSMANENLAPFYHGVASGDPLSDRVIIWTRVTPENNQINDNINVAWRVSLDTNFTTNVKSGVETTNANKDFTVKVDVIGLQPNTYYYFEFETNGARSLIGRTKTTPSTVQNINQLRFAVVSCSNYPAGYFNVYEKIFERNDLDAVIHLGDYIYEKASGNPDRPVLPDKEIVELGDYRLRHSTYKLDPSSMRMHQQYPMIATWDDHESSNDSWRDGSESHQPETEGDWQERKSASMQAYYEWMPLRLPDPSNTQRIWRKISYGNLADILVLDTRLYDRDEQDVTQTNNPSHKLLGPEQMSWLENELVNGTGQWKIIAQQVMMSNLIIPLFNIIINPDQWDGYNAERTALYDIILNNNVNNVVVLTGDIHTGWGNDLPYSLDSYKKGANRGSVAVEFVTPSVTSSSSPVPLPSKVYQLIKGALPHIKYVNLYNKGYNLLDLTPQRATNDFYIVNTIQNPESREIFKNQFFVNNNERFLRNPTNPKSPTVDSRPQQYQAPLYPRSNANRVAEENTVKKGLLTTLGIYPNPFMSQVSLQYNVQEKSSTNIRMFDVSGKLVREKVVLEQEKGMYIETIDTQNLPTGTYSIEITNGNDRNTHMVVKM